MSVSVFSRDMAGVCVDVCVGGGERNVGVVGCIVFFSRRVVISVGGSHFSILPL